MITQIIVPTSNILQVQIPDNLIGKEVEFSYEEKMSATKTTENSIKSKFKASDVFKDCRVDLSNYKFNRDEANDYDNFFEKSKIDFIKDIDAFYDNIHLDMSNYKFNRDEANER
jgi:hypothetical protein